MSLLFVYGTLKQGFSRNQALKDQRYLGTAKTAPVYGMYAYGGFPALVDFKLAEESEVSASNSIFGEVYEVTDTCILEIDKIEGVEFNLFERKIVEIKSFTLLRLPLFQESWNHIEKNTAQAYLFRRNLKGAANCGSFWARGK